MKVLDIGRWALGWLASAALLTGCGASPPQTVPVGGASASTIPDLRISDWRGKLTQPFFGTYSFEIQVQTSSGAQISGTSRIEYGSEWAVMSFTGTTSHGTVNYTETAILQQHGGNWCIKSARLHFRHGRAVLKGPWTASGCTGGEIRVQR